MFQIFEHLILISSDTVLSDVFSCYVNSQDFNQLCSVYGVSIMFLDE